MLQINNADYNVKLSLIPFSKLYFIKQSLKFLMSLKSYNNLNSVYYVILNLLIFFFDIFIINFYKQIVVNRVHNKSLFIHKNNTLNDWLNLIINIINYYKVNAIYLLNFNHFNYLYFNLIYTILNMPYLKDWLSPLLFEESITLLKWLSLGTWGYFTTLFIRKKYKENRQYFNFKKKEVKFNSGWYLWWKANYKYNLNYSKYVTIKKMLQLLKCYNKHYIYVYNMEKDSFLFNFNAYENNIFRNYSEDALAFAMNKDTAGIAYPLSVNDYKFNIVNMFNFFIKAQLENPFKDTDILFYFNLNKLILSNDVFTMELQKIAWIASFLYFYKKKGILYKMNNEEVIKTYTNYNDFFLDKVSKTFNIVSGTQNWPLLTPPDLLLKYRNIIEYDNIFKNFIDFNVSDLVGVLNKVFISIAEAQDLLCENPGIEEYHKSINYHKTTYNNNYDFSLLMWLNKEAFNNKKFLRFMADLRDKFKGVNVSTFVLNFNLFDEPFLDTNSLLNKFIQENFFYLDYFTIVVNQYQYSLCQLLFTYKIKKNMHDYEIYYNNYCQTFYRQYININDLYHKQIYNKVSNLSKSIDYYLKYKYNDSVVQNNYNNNTSNFLKTFNKFKKWDFTKVYRKDAPYLHNIVKPNIKNYQQFLYHFESYNKKFNFKKYQIKERLLSFDEFMYSNYNLELLNEAIEQKKVEIKKISKHYKFKANKLESFNDLGFYLHDIEGYESFKNDVEMFITYRDELLVFKDDDISFLFKEKIDFQFQYSTLYFHYLINVFKNFKSYQFNVLMDDLIFNNDKNYSFLDLGMQENKKLFLSSLEKFTKGFKSLITNKNLHFVGLINFLAIHGAHFKDQYQAFDFNCLYNTNYLEDLQNKEETMQRQEQSMDDIVQSWNSILERLEVTRKFYVNAINLLSIDNFEDFFNIAMFKDQVGYTLFKNSYYNILLELYTEERALDHANVITMCLYRVFEQHYIKFNYRLFQHGYFPKLNYITISNFKMILNSLEPQNPLIFIEIYNSKQRRLKNSLWTPSLSFLVIIQSLNNYSEKDKTYEEEDVDWLNFINEVGERDVIMYDLDMQKLDKVTNFIIEYNNAGYDQLKVEEQLIIFIKNNNLQYNKELELLCKQRKERTVKTYYDKEEHENDPFVIKNSVEERTVKTYYDKEEHENDPFVIKNSVEERTVKTYYDKEEHENDPFVIKNNNVEVNNKKVDMDFTLFKSDLLLDTTFNNVESNMPFFTYLENKLASFKDSNFKYYLITLFNILKQNYSKTESDFDFLKEPTNYLYYLTLFNDRILKLNNFNNDSCSIINKIVFNNDCNTTTNYKLLNIEYINKFMSKSFQEGFNKGLVGSYNNSYLYLLENGVSHFFNIFNILDNSDSYSKMDYKWHCNVDKDLKYLPNLNHYILNKNYNKPTIYDFHNLDQIGLTFKVLLSKLNLYILKAHFMLNTLIHFNYIINNTYLQYCSCDTNNIAIVHELYIELSKDTSNAFNIQLINLLLYVKDPIYLYNILTEDLKCYVENLLNVLIIIQKPDLNKDLYNNFLISLTLKIKEVEMLKNKNGESLIFNNAICNDEAITNFYSNETLTLLNNNITNLELYNGYFNLDLYNFDNINYKEYTNNLESIKESGILTVINLEKLLVDFNYIFVINQKELYINYSAPEILLLLKVNVFKKAYSHIDLLNNLIKEKKKNNLLNTVFNNSGKELKTKSAKAILILLQKKTKMAKFKKNKIIEAGDEGVWDHVYSDSEYEELEVTDSENDNSDIEDISNILIVDKADKMVDQERVNRKVDLMTSIVTDFRQWASDLEYNQAYIDCLKSFEVVFNDYNHPIWEPLRAGVKNEHVFKLYISKFTDEQKSDMFDNFWDLTIQEVQKKRAKKEADRFENKWFSFLRNIKIKREEVYVQKSDIKNSFDFNLKRNKRWHQKWHNECYFLNKPVKMHSDWKVQQHWKFIYDNNIKNEDDTVTLDNDFKLFDNDVKKKQEGRLWRNINWWKNT